MQSDSWSLSVHVRIELTEVKDALGFGMDNMKSKGDVHRGSGSESGYATDKSYEFERFYEESERAKYDWFREVADRIESDEKLR